MIFSLSASEDKGTEESEAATRVSTRPQIQGL